jgi:hypothetical protein
VQPAEVELVARANEQAVLRDVEGRVEVEVVVLGFDAQVLLVVDVAVDGDACDVLAVIVGPSARSADPDLGGEVAGGGRLCLGVGYDRDATQGEEGRDREAEN